MAYTAEDLIAIATNEIGYHEKVSNSDLDSKTGNSGSGNYTKYARDLYKAGYYNGNKNGYAWCDVFVDWCFYMLCGKDKSKAEAMECQTGDLGAGCQYSKQYYHNAGQLDTRPKIGDQIFFISDGTVSHTGIVESVTDSQITTIEGNSSNQVKRNTYSRTSSKIDSFGHPKYDSASTTTTKTKTVDELAQEVLDGLWGNGDSRKVALTNAGYDYDSVQAKVNELLKETSTNVLYPDISHYHPVTNWTKIKANCPFIISKATQRQSYIDPTLEDFINGCETNKLPYWVYTYLEKGDEKAQAKFMVETCKDLIGSYFVGYVLDIEDNNKSSNIQDALDYLVGLGYKTMLYTGYADYSTYKTVITNRPDSCAWWEARYGKNTGYYNTGYPCHDGVDLHQYTSVGSCPGVSGDCDLNRICGSKNEVWFKTPLSSDTSSSNSSSTKSSTSSSSSSTKSSSTSTTTTSSSSKLKVTSNIKSVQTWLNSYYKTGLSVDGIYGPKTKAAIIKSWQTEVGGLTVDGIYGTKSASKGATTIIKNGSIGIIVTIWQAYLVCRGYSPNGIDGIFGSGCTSATKSFQKKNSLTQDGIVGKNTWKKAFA